MSQTTHGIARLAPTCSIFYPQDLDPSRRRYGLVFSFVLRPSSWAAVVYSQNVGASPKIVVVYAHKFIVPHEDVIAARIAMRDVQNNPV